MFRNVFGGCVSDRSTRTETFRSTKLKFGVPINVALKNGNLPSPLVDMLVYIAKEGVATADVFRRPGNPNDIRRIVKRLSEGRQVIYPNYSFYTLASVVKKFLLKIPGGVLTADGEETLLQVLTLGHRLEQCQAVYGFIESLSRAHQQLLALLFGTWFRIISYSEVNLMSVEALSRSVAGSMFHTCAEDPAKVEKASRIMQLLIDNFGVTAMFGQDNIQFFAETTHTGVHIRELFHYHYQYSSQETLPPVSPDFIEVSHLEGDSDHEAGGVESDEMGVGGDSPELSPLAGLRRQIPSSEAGHDGDISQLTINVSTLSAPEVSLMPSPEVSKRPKSLEDNLNEMRSYYQSRSLSRFNSVKRKQLERLRQRSDWFLSPTVISTCSVAGTTLLGHSFKHMHHHNGKNNGSSKNGGGCSGTGCGSSNGCGSGKNSGNSVTKASSEGTVLEAFSDADSVFTDHSSRSESPASEPVWSHILQAESREVIHSDTLAEIALPHVQSHYFYDHHSRHHHHHHHHLHRHHHHNCKQTSGGLETGGADMADALLEAEVGGQRGGSGEDELHQTVSCEPSGAGDGLLRNDISMCVCTFSAGDISRLDASSGGCSLEPSAMESSSDEHSVEPASLAGHPVQVKGNAAALDMALARLERECSEGQTDLLVVELTCLQVSTDPTGAGDGVQGEAVDVEEVIDQENQKSRHDESCETGQPHASADQSS